MSAHHEYTIEHIYHFTCGKCSQWWSYAQIELTPPHHIKTIEITEARFEKILGVPVAMKDIWNIIKRLGFEKIEEDVPQVINVSPPIWRSDISIQDDIIEEYARISGYDNLPTSPLASPIPSQGSENPQAVREHMRDRLVSAGMNETISYSITDLETINLFDSISSDQQPISIANPLDVSKKYLRPTLVPNVLETLSRNRRTDQQNGLRLFEIGRVFLPLQTDEIDSMPVEKEEIVGAITGFSTSTDLWSESGRLMDFFDAKGIVEHTFRGLSGVLSFTKNDGTMYETGKKADIFLNEVTPFLGKLNPDELILEVYQTCAFLNSLALKGRWTDNLSKQVVQDIVEVAIADDKVLQSEINLIKAIAATLGIIEDETFVKVLDTLNANVVNP